MKSASIQELQQEVRSALVVKQLIRLCDVKKRVGLSRSAIYDMIKKGVFPKSISLSNEGRAVAWLSSEIDDYIDSRISASKLA